MAESTQFHNQEAVIKSTKSRSSWLRTTWRNYVIPILMGFLIAKIITTWGVGLARVPTASMYPTIPNPCYIVDDHLATDLFAPYRGEVVLFHWPDNPREIFVKRIIGMPGDTVTIHGGSVFVNGKKLSQPYLHGLKTKGTFGPYHVPPGHYFMLGDNRNNSLDSRYWTYKYVPRSFIIGRADAVIWPWYKVKGI